MAFVYFVRGRRKKGRAKGGEGRKCDIGRLLCIAWIAGAWEGEWKDGWLYPV